MDKAGKAKEYLQSLKRYRRKRNGILEKLMRINCRLRNPATSNYSGVKVTESRDPDKLGELIAVKMKLENQLAENNLAECMELFRIGGMIDELPTPLYSRFLSLRYEGNNTMQEIANKMGYDVNYIRHLHNPALSEFYDVHLSGQESKKENDL